MSNKALLEVKDLCIGFQTENGIEPITHNINICIHRGEIGFLFQQLLFDFRTRCVLVDAQRDGFFRILALLQRAFKFGRFVPRASARLAVVVFVGLVGACRLELRQRFAVKLLKPGFGGEIGRRRAK